MCTDCLDVIFKIFITSIIIGSIIAVACILFVMGIIANIFVLLYFAVIGWFAELEICDCCHRKFLVKGLQKPWEPLGFYISKIYEFYEKPICKKYWIVHQ